MNINQAKRVSLPALMQRLGYEHLRERGGERWYRSPFRDESNPSFKLHLARNVWYDFGEGRGGGVLEFVQTLYRLPDVSATLAKLADLVGEEKLPRPPRSAPSQRATSEAEPSWQVISLGEIKHPALIRYLGGRGVSLATAKEHLQEAHYLVGDKSYFALAMLCDPIDGQEPGLEIRNEHFKGSLGRKNIRTITGKARSVNVFEGMFDFLSHEEIEGQNGASSIILNSAAMKERAIARIQELDPKTVHLYFDHDETGRKLTDYFREALPDRLVRDRSGLYARHRDLNDYHVAGAVSPSQGPETPTRPTNRQLSR